MPDGLVYGFNKKGLWVLDAATGKPVHGDKAITVTPPGPPQPSYRVWGNRWTAPAIAALEALKEWLAMAEGTDLVVKRDLMKALAALGPKGKPALPAVLGALARPWEACVQEPAAAALKAMVAADHEALSHPDPQVRRMVLPRLEVPGWMRNSALRDAGGGRSAVRTGRRCSESGILDGACRESKRPQGNEDRRDGRCGEPVGSRAERAGPRRAAT